LDETTEMELGVEVAYWAVTIGELSTKWELDNELTTEPSTVTTGVDEATSVMVTEPPLGVV
jgi:hypothetical protein